MQSRCRIGAQSIIHKPMLGDAAATGESGSANPYAEMRAVAQTVGAGMTGVGGTFVDNLQVFRRQGAAQRRF
jgi:hypothetical protein